MSIFKCKMCGGELEIQPGQTVAECEYCGTKQTLPRLDDDRRANLYDRANHFRRNNEFDKAMGIYEKILTEDSTDAESYWSLVLCRYGIEYVEDPATHKRVPTVNRAQFTSIFDDDNYKSAIQYADSYQRSIYEAEAKAINEIQKGILAISQKEEPFDVFICYKESDSNGRRTPDSVLANDLYHQLTQEGFKVFFSRITLEDKLGSAYEPYIFAALNSAKVMVVLGTRPEYFSAVWVKNEWSRYLSLIRQGQKKMLIPAYKDMDPYDLPEEFSHLQAQDMSKLGFMQDLIRGIKKLIDTRDEPNSSAANTQSAASELALLKRGKIALDDHEWEKAETYFERVLDENPESSQAYLGKLFSSSKCEDLKVLEKKLINEATRSSNANEIQISARTPDARRISKAVTEYEVPKFLTRADIQKRFEYNLTFSSAHSHYETQLDSFNNFCANDKNFRHALSYANSNEKEEIEAFKMGVINKLQDLIDKAKNDDETRKNNILRAYDEFLDDVENILKQQRAAALVNSKKAAVEKKKKATMCAIAGCIAVVVFIIWAFFQTHANAERAATIEENLIGKSFSDSFTLESPEGYTTTYAFSYTFDDNRKVVYYTSSRKKYNGTSWKDDFSEHEFVKDYSVSVGLFGKITIAIDDTSYTLEVDDHDKPLSMDNGRFN